MQKLWAEIRRRNLHRVTAGYAVVGWVLFQAAGIAFPAFAMPDWTFRLLVILLIAGLPILWVGLWLAHPAAEQTTSQGPLHHTEWVLIGLLGLVLIATLGEFGYSQFKSQSAATAPLPAQATNEASIAVLPFVNMSGDPSKEYFSDGISEELLNDLANNPGLRVAARTSSFSFKGKSEDIQQIALTLHVRAVLEGSVRQAGNRVRITAQLINAADGYHLWSATYDRDLTDILTVQDEIARAITRELTGRLIPNKSPDAIASKPKIKPEAYTAYLQGRFFMAKRNVGDMERAIEFFKQAIGLENDYADAHASLGRTYWLLYSNGQRRDTLQAAEDETATALHLDPTNAPATLNKALIAMAQWNWLESDARFREALKLNPNDADALHFYASLLSNLNLQDAAITVRRRAVVLDPLAPIIRSNLGDELYSSKRMAEAAVQYQAALAIDPNFAFALSGLCLVDVNIGKIDDAKKILEDRLIAAEGQDGTYTDYCGATIAARSSDWPELKRLSTVAEQRYASGNMPASIVGYMYALADDREHAMEWFGKSYDERDQWLFYLSYVPDVPEKFRADPRWKAFMQRPLCKDWQAARDRVAAELATAR